MILAALLTLALPQAATGPVAEGPSALITAVTGTPAALSTRAPGQDPFTPESVITLSGGLRAIKLPAHGSPVLAIRVSVLLDETQNESGAGKLIQIFGVQRVQGRAAVRGLHFEGARTPWGITYTIAGARSDLGDMAQLLHEALAEPETPDTEFQRQRRLLWENALRTMETPAARILAELKARAAPGTPPIDGTPTTLERMTRVTLEDVWARTHRPASMTVVVAGDVPDAELRSALDGLGAQSSPPSNRAGGAPQASGGRATQVYRQWYGEAYRVADPQDPRAAVVALLAADVLRSRPEPFEAEVQLVELRDIQLLTSMAAAYTPDAASMRQRMPALLAETRQSLTSDRVQLAVSRVRQEMLGRARTPAGLVSVVGRYLDATGDASSARRYLDALDEVTAESTRAFITRLEGQAPLRAEVRP
jgi:predicted Zn-dependent peptidase